VTARGGALAAGDVTLRFHDGAVAARVDDAPARPAPRGKPRA
jgi:hypothetical protein